MFGKRADRILRRCGYVLVMLFAIAQLGHVVSVFRGVMTGRNSAIHLFLDLLFWIVVGGGLPFLLRDTG